jgi:hypothetical protein
VAAAGGRVAVHTRQQAGGLLKTPAAHGTAEHALLAVPSLSKHLGSDFLLLVCLLTALAAGLAAAARWTAGAALPAGGVLPHVPAVTFTRIAAAAAAAAFCVPLAG